ncbi:MAG: ABC-2 family transporter protein [Clostridiales bacterium]|jgi:ABC-2 type transport system permease protein|nr:ABC-2 family transporter protein [Clostridiales bacterium]
MKVKKKLHLWYTLTATGLKTRTIYRASAWMASFWGMVTFLIQILIWRSLLGAGARFGTTFEEMLTYLMLTQIIVFLINSSAGLQIRALVRTGDISVYLLRPINLKTLLFFDDLGKNIFQAIVVTLPICAVLAAYFGVVLPQDPLVYLYVSIMLLNGMAMLFLYRYTLGLVSFWFVENPFIEWHFQNIESIFSGAVLPLWLCPAWLAALSQYLPFRYFTYEPLALFVGKSELSVANNILIHQYIWLAALFALERLVSTRAMRKLTLQGG